MSQQEPSIYEAEQAKIDRAERDKHAARLEAEDICWLMGSKQGRRVMWRLLEKTGVFRSSFTGDNETFFREGMRNVGLMLLAQVNGSCPEQYALMMQEHKDVRTSSTGSRAKRARTDIGYTG